MTEKYMDKFDYRILYRFYNESGEPEVDENGSQLLPSNELEEIRPLTEEYALKCWQKWISKNKHHYMLLGKDINRDAILKYIPDCGHGNPLLEEKTSEILQSNLLIPFHDRIILFWEKQSCAIETEWGLFVKHWPKFCYVNDEGDIIIIPNYPKALVYAMDRIWIVGRQNYFGLE